MVTGLLHRTERKIQTQILKEILNAPSFAVPAKDGKCLGMLSFRNSQERWRALGDDFKTLAHTLSGNPTSQVLFNHGEFASWKGYFPGARCRRRSDDIGGPLASDPDAEIYFADQARETIRSC